MLSTELPIGSMSCCGEFVLNSSDKQYAVVVLTLTGVLI